MEGTDRDTAVTLPAVTGATLSHTAREKRFQPRPVQRFTRGTVTTPLQKQANVIGMGADFNFIETQISNMRRTDMSKATHTHEHSSPEPKAQGCCGGSHTKDEKAQPAAQQKAKPAADSKRDHAHDSHGGAGCCGGGKASK
jgi:hypothetical protein